MNERRKVVALKREIDDSRPLYSLTVGEFRQLLREQSGESRPENNADASADELIDAQAAMKRLGVSKEWIYHHAAKLPFARKLGPRTLRFDLAGLRQWVQTKNKC